MKLGSLKLYTPFTKSEKVDDDKARIVYGILTDETEDLDGEVVEYEASKEALSKWPGNVREMHQPSAVGTAVDLVFDDEKRQVQLAAKIVDPTAIRKIDEGVYRGFSVGGDQAVHREDKPNRVNKYRMIEASVVDAPANPSSLFTMWKMTGGDPNGEEEPPAPAPSGEEGEPDSSGDPAPEPAPTPDPTISIEAFQAIAKELRDLVSVLRPETTRKAAEIAPIGDPLKKMAAVSPQAEGSSILAKQLSDIGDTLRKVNEAQDSLTKRLVVIEGALKPGGPALSAEALLKLAGAQPADKNLLSGGSATTPQDEEAVLAKMVAEEYDPQMKEKLSRKLAGLQIKKIQTGQPLG